MKRSFIVTLALIAAIAAPLYAPSGWARGLGVLAMGGGTPPAAGGVVSYDSVGSTAWALGISLSLGTPAGSYPGSLLVATVCSDTYITSLTSDGWTLAEKSSRTSDFAVYVLYKIEGESEPSTHSFTANTSADMGGYIVRYAKSGGTWAVSDTSEWGYSAASGSQPFGEVVATKGDSIVHLVYGSDDYFVDVRYMSAPPDGATLIAGRTSGSSAEVHLWYQSIPAGAYNNSVGHIGTVISSQIAVVIEAQ